MSIFRVAAILFFYNYTNVKENWSVLERVGEGKSILVLKVKASEEFQFHKTSNFTGLINRTK